MIVCDAREKDSAKHALIAVVEHASAHLVADGRHAVRFGGR